MSTDKLHSGLDSSFILFFKVDDSLGKKEAAEEWFGFVYAYEKFWRILLFLKNHKVAVLIIYLVFFS